MKDAVVAELEFVGRALRAVLGALLPSWLVGGSMPDSHGGSRWARPNEHRLLGRKSAPEHAWGDGIAIGFLGRRLLQMAASVVNIQGMSQNGAFIQRHRCTH